MSALGEFLRARRQATTPDQVGLPHIGGRRTPGLRRSEVAELAGISIDYYMRLEQGRERHPSEQVLEALARVFQLGPEATEHLHDLVRPRRRRVVPADRADQINPAVVELVQSWSYPALVLNRRLDVIFKNRLGATICAYGNPEYADNLLRHAFYEPDFYQNWDSAVGEWVAHLRATAGPHCDDPFLLELIEELSGIDEFRRMWARHDVRTNSRGLAFLRHSEVGDLKLTYETLPISSAPGQIILVCQSLMDDPFDDSVAKLRELLAK
ncbi:transcriptional regulator [Planotetraspora silvatica]|uniref:Transcriptional regulator n=1 Tax=Planotetraspora silvatica TaxID=234614 RepID=A0A8J3UPJ6_9ACTN|nr:helix-turn-helix transcriptional regulator [Planotetraspora silvatica]GII48310.1 transcriptional regulator [Planotetraspora silvatica]